MKGVRTRTDNFIIDAKSKDFVRVTIDDFKMDADAYAVDGRNVSVAIISIRIFRRSIQPNVKFSGIVRIFSDSDKRDARTISYKKDAGVGG